LYLGTNFMPPVIHPTKQIVNHTFSTTVVPHIHPVHTTTINHHMFQHKHYCPHSCSSAQECSHQHIDCCKGGMPGPTMTGPAVAPNALPNAQMFPQGGRPPGFMPGAFPGRRPF
jgi:spore coat protein D